MSEGIQQAVEQLLEIEREANAIVERAKAEARRLRTEGAEVADATRREAIAQARQMADKMLAGARSKAEVDRDKRLAQSALELEELVRSARRRKEIAVQYVVERLKGEEQTPYRPSSRGSVG